ncbi:asparagine synthase-related protein [Knoellia pratensis]|uniref:asparagine synthase-related protein n=1 Tax=Knoellia pratensis TaxID=3404796 RepID=UPI00361354B7
MTLSAGGEIRFTQWWSAPEAVLGAREAASLLAEAIEDAVAARADRGSSLSCDLSGGLDSTSVAFAAARADVALTTFREGSNDPAHDDWRWAELASEALTGRHVVVDLEGAPVDFDPAPPSVSDADGPFAWQRARAGISAAAVRAAQAGSRDHLTGHGGDEVFDVGPANDHSAFQSGALRYARLSTASRLNRRWTTARHLRLLADRTSYSQWLAGAGSQDLRQDLASSPPGTSVWGSQPLLAPWMTDDAEDMVRTMLTKTPDTLAPLSPWRAQHALLSGARQCGAAMRRCDQITREAGVRWHAPLLDDRVIEVEMATSFEARVSPGTYKPTLVAAMVGRVPQELLGRPSKADFSRDMYVALRHNRAEMLRWCDDLRLGSLELVDPQALRASILGNHPTPPSMIQLFTTLAAESWLRSVPMRGRVYEGAKP